MGAYDKDYDSSSNEGESIDYMQKAKETVANFENMPESLQKKLADGLKKKAEAASQALSVTDAQQQSDKRSGKRVRNPSVG